MTPAQFKALWAATQAHHQAGRFAEAERGYRQVLASMPRHFDALHMLGVVALQQGRLDAAEASIREALGIDGKSAAAHNNLGNVYLRRDDRPASRASFERAIQLQPSLGDAHYNLAQLLRREGRGDEALPHLRRAAALNPRSASAQSLLGAALREAGDLAGAVKAFDQAARLQPTSPDALANLGAALCGQGQLKRAEEVLRRALRLAPGAGAAMTNLGNVLIRLGRTVEAVEQFRAVVAQSPRSAEALCNLGGALREEGNVDEAMALLRQAVAIDPGLDAAQTNLAEALADKDDAGLDAQLRQMRDTPAQSLSALLIEGSRALGRDDFVAAQSFYRNAAELVPASAEAQLGLGHASMGLGRVEEARVAYQRAIDVDPELGSARWGLTMAQLDPIAADASAAEKSREAFARALGQLDRWFAASRRADGHRAVASTQPFYLAYQARENRELLNTYGRLCARLMRPWQEAQGIAAAHDSSRQPGRRLRVGFATAHVRDHSVWNAIVKGWIRGLDARRFDIYLYHLGMSEDAETQWAEAAVSRFEGGRRTLAQWARTIAQQGLDALIYPEIGMHALTTRLASMRLAGVQAAAWGHPETTGLPTIDVYLSAAALEPPGADAHYTERLVRLANLGVSVERVGGTAVAPDLRSLGLPPDRPLLLCPGMPFKYRPEHDAVWLEIARRVPDARLVFFRSRAGELADRLAARLRARFASEGVAFDEHVAFVPFLDRPRFLGLMQRASLYLDTIGFSGFNTALQALECGLPVVSVEGPFMRGRLASALLRHIGLDELVAADEGDYVRVVEELAASGAEQARLRQSIAANRDRLFGDDASVRDLECFLLEARGG